MWDDIRFAGRLLMRFKQYAIAATTTLALAIGATTAVFSVIDATLLRPLPYADPDRLLFLNVAQSDQAGVPQPLPITQIELLRWREGSSTLEAIEGVEARTVALVGDREPVVVNVGAITSGLFPTLGAHPALGRLFTGDEERQDAGVAILSHSTWSNRFSANPTVLGQTISLGGRSYEVIGVMRPGFRELFDRSEIWVPMHPTNDPNRQNLRVMFAIGRLRRGFTIAQAQSELTTLQVPLAKEFVVGSGKAKPTVTWLSERLHGQQRPTLLLLGTAVVGLLILACANVANLTLGHLATRQGELATRVLMGATSGAIFRLLLLQTSLLAGAGGVLGLVGVATALPALLSLYNGASLVGAIRLGIDWRVVLLTLLIVVGTILLCALVPAMKIHRSVRRGQTIRMAAVRFSAGPLERALRAALVSAQVAIAVALLSASGVLSKSLSTVLAIDPGFAADHVLSLQMMLPPALYPDVASRATVVRRMIERVQGLPDVVAVGSTQSTFLPNQSMFTLMYVEGVHIEEPDRSAIRHITPGYFAALRVPVLQGRPIDARDQIDAPPVCMVSDSFARKYFPNGDAIGHRVRRNASSPWMTIVGVVGDVRDDGLVNDPGPILYTPYFQTNTPTARVSLMARTTGDPVLAAASIRQAIWGLDRNQPIDRMLSLDRVLLEGTSAEQFRTLLVSIFAVVGSILAIIGVYAVTSAAVTARTWEASLRLALGASPWRVGGGLVRESSAHIAIGVVLGGLLFYLSRQLLSGVLFRTAATHAPTVLAAAIGMLALGVIAASLQARRLAAVSPALGLRGQELQASALSVAFSTRVKKSTSRPR
jgi:putative ABC transport system permease protein